MSNDINNGETADKNAENPGAQTAAVSKKDLSPAEITRELSVAEKASLASGKSFWTTQEIDRLGVPSVMMTDGPHGIRRVDETKRNNIMQQSHKATCFPPAVTVASTWNRELAYEIGGAIADEAKSLGVTTVLGPGVNVKRSPLCGRNFEYFSEDPYAAGEMGAALVKGVQSQGIGTSLKHFAANNQEKLRMSISAEVDERTMREIYLPAFEKVVKDAQPTTVMCSYNRINGTFLSDNKKYLTDILRDEWGYRGIVVSDWGAVNDRVKGIQAGLDLQMPHSADDNSVIENAVASGELSESDLDKTTERVVKFAIECKKNEYTDHKADFEKNHALARKVAADGAVLLKNEDGILPLTKQDLDDCVIIGALAKFPRYQGTGSSKINANNAVSFTDYLDAQGLKYKYFPGYSLKKQCYNKKMLLEARAAAKTAKTVIIFAGLTPETESEGFDRSHLNLPTGQISLINEIAPLNGNIIVVLSGGSPVKMPFLGNVKAVLNLYLGGEACGEAAADILFGAVNPSGKLSETFPLALADVFASKYFPMGPRTVEYRENVFVGYRYFDTAKKSVLFPFGYGLSYTKFEYSNLKLSAENINESDVLEVSFDIKNVGKFFGGEVAQVYVKDVESTIFRPEKELKGFEKVYLDPGETKTVRITLDKRAFSYYNVNISDWAVESGEFEILVGSSSRDILLEKSVNFNSEYKIKHPDYRKSAPSYYKIGSVLSIPDGDFEKLTGRKINENLPLKKGEFDRNSTLEDIRVTAFGKVVGFVIGLGARIVAGGSENKDMVINTIKDTTIRTFGMISPPAMKFVLKHVNGSKKKE
ncbi:MAG: glycoside hydrolase family 3 C-terminal domain-containing protein [Clostridiales bacterium]|jgi:beta-glucosidase|nr:glycoside hydrolase family 3 C-terminal domain-containing protein [Clostridiales bacterium]